MNLSEKLLIIRKALKDKGLKKEGNGYSFRFFDMPDIEPIITDLCAEYKVFTLVSFPEGKATMTVADAEKPIDYYQVEVTPKECTMKSINPIQSTGAMMSYMRRYLYLTVFCISESDIIDNIETQIIENSIAAEQESVSKEVEEKLRLKALIDSKFNNYSAEMINYSGVKKFEDLDMDWIKECMKNLGVTDGKTASKK